ncbi:iron ABC transporter ATP-binding protein, partial [Staphylococcus pseudintermedius]
LILDEPANGLDFVGREQLMATLSQIRQHFPQTVVIYVSHFIEEVTEDFTHALLLKQGTIQNQGRIEAVLTNHTLSQLF